MDTENRLIDIETKLAFQEDTVQELNKIVYQQQLQIEQLQYSIKRLRSKIKAESGAAMANVDPSEEIPPHY